MLECSGSSVSEEKGFARLSKPVVFKKVNIKITCSKVLSSCRSNKRGRYALCTICNFR